MMGISTAFKDPSRVFTREQIDNLLSSAIGKTLLEVDKSGQFECHCGHTKVTGIAGDIVEISILGCKRDSRKTA